MSANLYGTPTDLSAGVDESYESPSEYADQGDTRKIRDLSFSYLAETQDAAGNTVRVPVDLPRDREVTIEQIGLLALAKGEANHSFYTTLELERQTGRASTDVSATANVSEMGEHELSDWLLTDNPDTGRPWTINEVLEQVGTDKDLANRMLAAENIRTSGDPRRGLEVGLTEIIERTD
jgi:hypothetical protein